MARADEGSPRVERQEVASEGAGDEARPGDTIIGRKRDQHDEADERVRPDASVA